jgi:DNA-binding response OmpR family regulator
MSKVLLAEDDHTMVSLLKTLLKMEGFEVVLLDVRADVPAVVSQEKPANLLMDVHLGGQNGIEIVQKIRKNHGNDDINIVMTSGLNVKEECLRHGADHFLLKPFMPDDLLSLLKK